MLFGKMKRVGIDAHMLGDHSGGNETYYKNILEAMVVPNDMEIYLFVKNVADVSKLKDKFKIVYFGTHDASYRNLIEIPYLCMKYKLDLFHAQYFIPFIRPCKFVVTIHDICFEHYKDIFTKREYLRQKLLIPYAAKKSHLIFTVSDFSKNDISTCYKINPEKIVVTYNGVAEDFRQLSEEEINRESLSANYGIRGDYILTVGNLQPRKNIVRLIKAFSLLENEYESDIQLVIVGKKAWMYDEIFEEVGNSKNNVIFTDYVESNDLVRLYNGAKCFVYPSIFEGFGIPPLEALACGTPVAVSNTSSLPEVVGDNGVYFDPLDYKDIEKKINEIINTEKKKKIFVDRFSWVKSSEIIMSYYTKLLVNVESTTR